jgi:hypothetical protein
MVGDPDFAAWIVDGVGAQDGPPDSRSAAVRFAEHEPEPMNGTNALHAAGGKLNLPDDSQAPALLPSSDETIARG